MNSLSQKALSLMLLASVASVANAGSKKSDESSGRGSKMSKKVQCARLLKHKLDVNLSMLDTIEDFIDEQRRIPTESEFLDATGYNKDDLKNYYKMANVKDYDALIKRFRKVRTGVFTQLRKEELKWVSNYISTNLSVPDADDLLARHKELDLAGYTDIYGAPDSIIEDSLTDDSPGCKNARKKIAAAYAKLARGSGRIPYLEELAAALGREDLDGIVPDSGDDEQSLFKNQESLTKMARLLSPSSFATIVDQTKYGTEEQDTALLNAIKKRKRMIVTSAISGLKVDPELFASLQVYAKENDAEIIVVPVNMITEGLDPILLKTPGVHIAVDTVRLASWLSITDTSLMAKMINPDMRLERLAQDNHETLIYAAPRLNVKTVATVDNKQRNLQLWSTGCINRPSYRSSSHAGRRTDKTATFQHEMGAVLVEKVDTNTGGRAGKTIGDFTLRHLEWTKLPRPGDEEWKPEERGFMDLGKYYTATGSRDMRPEKLILGDLHIASIDPQAVATIEKLIRTTRPKKLVIHDFFDGESINHHEAKMPTILMQKYLDGKLDLAEELARAASVINLFLAADPELVIEIDKSNHDDWLRKLIAFGKFLQYAQPKTAVIASELTPVIVSGRNMTDSQGNNVGFTQDPIEYALVNGFMIDPRSEKREYPGIDDPRRVSFLKTGGSSKVGPEGKPWAQVETGYHGDMGAHGARAGTNPGTQAKSAGRIVHGHIHYEQMRNNGGVAIGTLQPRRVNYTAGGFSGWGASVALVSEYGQIEVLQLRDGTWFLSPEDEKNVDGDEFFQDNFPVMEKNNRGESNDAGYDQYTDRSRK